MVESPCYKTIEANGVTPLATPSPGTYYNPKLLVNGSSHKIPSCGRHIPISAAIDKCRDAARGTTTANYKCHVRGRP